MPSTEAQAERAASAGATSDALPPLLPLRLAAEHLDELEALWHLRRHCLFSRQRTLADLQRLDERMGRHLDALRIEGDGAEREALLRLQAPMGGEVFAACLALAHIRPELLRDEAGTLRPSRREMFPILDALRHGPSLVGSWASLRDATLLDAASFHEPVRRGIAIGTLWSSAELRRSALLAVARHPEPPEFALVELEQAATAGDGDLRTAGLYGLGLAATDRFEAFVEGRLGDDVFEVAGGALCLGMFGGATTAARIARRIEACGPTTELVQALGLLGIARSLPLLCDLLGHTERHIVRAALASLYTISGRRFVVEPAATASHGVAAMPSALAAAVARHSAAEGSGVSEPDLQAASAYVASGALDQASSERWHLGRALRAPDAAEGMPMSFLWLRSLVTGEPPPLRWETPDALFGEGYGALELPADHLLAVS